MQKTKLKKQKAPPLIPSNIEIHYPAPYTQNRQSQQNAKNHKSAKAVKKTTLPHTTRSKLSHDHIQQQKDFRQCITCPARKLYYEEERKNAKLASKPPPPVTKPFRQSQTVYHTPVEQGDRNFVTLRNKPLVRDLADKSRVGITQHKYGGSVKKVVPITRFENRAMNTKPIRSSDTQHVIKRDQRRTKRAPADHYRRDKHYLRYLSLSEIMHIDIKPTTYPPTTTFKNRSPSLRNLAPILRIMSPRNLSASSFMNKPMRNFSPFRQKSSRTTSPALRHSAMDRTSSPFYIQGSKMVRRRIK